MTDNTVNSQAFQLKGRLCTLTVLQLRNTDLSAIAHEIDSLITRAPLLLDKAPVVLDFSEMQPDAAAVASVIRTVRDAGLLPAAIQGGDAAVIAEAARFGLGLLHASGNIDKAMEVQDKTTTLPGEGEGRTRTITTPVRSGQQVVGKGGDLIVAAAVSHGAELLADGNIHVYGPLRGRALAGISGDRSARIFCQSLEADLVSIAGFYRLSDAIAPSNVPCQIYLEGESLQIVPL